MKDKPIYKNFIEVLDKYKTETELNYSDYVTLNMLINKDYVDSISKDTFATTNYYFLNSNSIWNNTTSINDGSSNLYLNGSGHFNMFFPMPNTSNASPNKTSFRNAFDAANSPYALWQKQHDVSNIFEKKPTKVEKIHKCIIDASMTNIDDILKIIENNPYKEDTEYNIDLKALCNIKDELIELNSMIGMSELKQSVIDQLFYFVQELHIGKNISDYKNTVFYGSPGTGKTDVAKIIGRMYSKLGILKNTVFKKVTRNDLIAGYLGQTAIKTRKVIDECIGGVLFIDEAYSLGNSDSNDSYSKECLDILCEAMSDNKNDLMVIIAGYEEELNDTFFRVNKGLQSRFIWRFNMGQYTPKELKLIFIKMIKEQDWSYVDDLGTLDKWFTERKDDFKNYGRDVELLLTYVKISHGRRIYGKELELKKKLKMEDLKLGHDTFLKNKKQKPVPHFMHTIYT